MVLQTELHQILDTVGIVVSLPALVLMATIMKFVFDIKHTAEDAASELKKKSARDDEKDERITNILDRLETRIDKAESRLDQWDGSERRAPIQRGRSR